ncbi:hypothetical protein ACSMXM_05435 [Pacificimonas sp. ICDLI1SI03]
MKYVLLLGVLALTGCDMMDPKVGLCEDAIKERLKSPSSYKRVEITKWTPERYTVDYDAENSYGAAIRNDADCSFNASTAELVEVTDGVSTTARKIDEITTY